MCRFGYPFYFIVYSRMHYIMENQLVAILAINMSRNVWLCYDILSILLGKWFQSPSDGNWFYAEANYSKIN